MPTAQGERGRKATGQSRAEEIRVRLLAWKQTPEPQRISLRAVGRELGTSHQLLGHYLTNWEKWQAKEYRRQAKQIRVSAGTETHPWIVAEMQRQAQGLEKAAFQSMIGSVLDDALRQLKRKARGGKLSRGELGMLRLFASRGYREAQKVLDRYSSMEKSTNNLPLIPSRTAKSFKRADEVAGKSAKMVSRAASEKTTL